MYFHSVHGKNIELSTDFSQAKRSTGFCQGITFSSSPLTQLQRVTFMVEKIPQSTWTGNLRIGLTSKNPSTLLSSELADFSYPTLCNTDSYWITCVKRSYVKPSNRLTIVLDKNNCLHLEINNVVKATLFDTIATSVQKLWLLLDIYGSTGTVQFLPSDETPYEIKKRGLDAVNNFHSACVTGGSKPIYKTMLLIVGQDNDAKKNLKYCLVNSNQKQKMRFGLSASFRVKIEESVWQLKTGRYTKKINSTMSRSKSNDSLYHTNRTRYKLEKSNSVDSIDDYSANSETSDEQDSDKSNDSDDDLYQIEELDELNQFDIDPNDMKQDPSGNSYRQIAVNIYRELYKNSIFDRIQSILTDKDNLSFNQDLILKIAIEEFESSLYSHLPCCKILLLFYKQVVLNEIKLIKFKSMGSTITVKSLEENEPNELEKITKNRLSLTISSHFCHQ
ncbi:neuralized PATS1 [Brachionus plicatilis]|uniref:Neuralized PATS1 n=1 Tax=Brachionus plicatilis TaxID=10195 RepID=A0A3M7PAR5_BRAPC|nr:neuralized PATS1 [Brachionus plicatilis]